MRRNAPGGIVRLKICLGILNPEQGEFSLDKLSLGKVLGLLFGCAVAGILIFMMFVILGSLMHREQ